MFITFRLAQFKEQLFKFFVWKNLAKIKIINYTQFQDNVLSHKRQQIIGLL